MSETDPRPATDSDGPETVQTVVPSAAPSNRAAGEID